MKKLLLLTFCSLSTAMLSAQPQPKGEWNFNDRFSPLKATIGENLKMFPEDSEGVKVESGPDGKPREAISVAIGTHLEMDLSKIQPNGGGKKINQWTLVFDVMRPFSLEGKGTGGNCTLFDTNNTTKDGSPHLDADFQLHGAGKLNVNFPGLSGWSTHVMFSRGEWHKLAITVDCGKKFLAYLDGDSCYIPNSYYENAIKDSLDGFFALQNTLRLAYDDNGQDGLIHFGKVQFFDRVLSGTEIAEMGGYKPQIMTKEELLQSAKGMWTFDDPDNLLKASVGKDLLPLSANPDEDPSFIKIDRGASGDGAILVKNKTYLQADLSDIPANGMEGAEKINNYTLMFDVKRPETALGKDISLYDSGTENPKIQTDEHEVRIGADGNFGCSTHGWSVYKRFYSGRYYRVVLSFASDSHASYFLDGEWVKSGNTVGSPTYHEGSTLTDRRFSLNHIINFFRDKKNSKGVYEDADVEITNLVFWDRSLIPSEIALLGACDAVYNEELPDPVGFWEFNAENFLKATIGRDLQIQKRGDAVEGIFPPVESGADEATEGNGIADGARLIGPNNHYVVHHNILPQSGETKVNDYTLVFDVSFPDVSDKKMVPLYQPILANNQKSAIYKGGTNDLGGDQVGWSKMRLCYEPNEWYRISVAVKGGECVKLYVNGGLECFKYDLDKNIRWGRDSLCMLDPQFYLFGSDESASDYPVKVSAVRLYDRVLNENQLLTLGKVPVISTPTSVDKTISESGSKVSVDNAARQIHIRSEKTKITIWNSAGQLIHQDRMKEEYIWSYSEQATGIYLIDLQADGKKERIKVILE
ncbi:MAG: hypothetical protein RR346_01695 [Bacteroidales bacterium]